ncbi:purine-nucleoside phosphorylase [Gottschalkiaceae bacterium SANA]|nr:purine-nucleoside phosphorylase [Gottschalkiaceae bacterium SANA]
MATVHIGAEKGDIAKTVLMPGDPLRAKFVADHYLTEVTLFNDVRNMLGYTGYYKGHRVSVMGSGMGMCSMGIYCYELYKFYDVENIIRIGSTGAYDPHLKVYDLVIAESAYSESTYALAQCGKDRDFTYPSKNLNDQMIEIAHQGGHNPVVAPIHTHDTFYVENTAEHFSEKFKKYGCVCVEDESFALFHNAEILGKQAATILTVSNNLVDNTSIDSDKRQNALTAMMEIALETAINL